MELAGADGVRALKDAPASNATTGHSVANFISFLNTIMNNNTTASKYTESAYGASSNSSSSEEQRKSCKCKHKKTKMSKSRETKKKEKDKDKEPKKTHALTARNTTARSPIASNRTNACGTRNIRNTASSQSAMS
jgi:hypothetical protein